MRPSAQFTAIQRCALTLVLLSGGIVTHDAQAQRSAAPPTPQTGQISRGPARRAKMWEGLAVSTKVTVKFNGRTYTRTADAQCEFDERAAAGTERIQWNVMYPPFGAQAEPATLRTFALAVLNPAPGKAVPFAFSFNAEGQSPLVQTFGRGPSGSGSVRVRREGNRAIFDVAAKDDRGRPITATLECSEVRKPEAVGG